MLKTSVSHLVLRLWGLVFVTIRPYRAVPLQNVFHASRLRQLKAHERFSKAVSDVVRVLRATGQGLLAQS